MHYSLIRYAISYYVMTHCDNYMLCYIPYVIRHTMLRNVILCYVMLVSFIVLCFVMLYYVKPTVMCYITLRAYVKLCYVIPCLCYIVIMFVMLY